MNILFCQNTYFNEIAKRIFLNYYPDGLIISGDKGDRWDNELEWYEPEILISYQSPWIIPKTLLTRSKLAINFHPASRDYPGSCCYNFAIYEGAKYYGVTCHIMEAKVDTGAIIAEKIFQVSEIDTPETLKEKTMCYLITLFDLVLNDLKYNILEESSIKWSRKPFTYQDFEKLKQITPDMTKQEVEKRKRACKFTGYEGIYTVIHETKFNYESKNP